MEIRDNRQKEWFWLDNEYLNGYAKHLGVMCTSVYIALCRHSDNKTQTCFPSMELIAEEIGAGRNAVSRAIKTLEEWGIVSVQEQFDAKNKKRKNNIYTLLSKYAWREKPCTNLIHGSAMHSKSEKPCTFEDESHAPQECSNNTHINNTNITIHSAPQADAAPFILEEKLESMESKPGKHLDIIATFIRVGKLQPRSSAELTAVIKRYAKIAATLTAFVEPDGTMPRIFNACKVCQEESQKLGYQWSLDTVYKKLTQ